MRAQEDQDRLVSMGTALRVAEKTAPTHPHPWHPGQEGRQKGTICHTETLTRLSRIG